MTDRGTRPADSSARSVERETMADVDHTHPYTNETFGVAFRRGPVVADGGPEADGDGVRPDGGPQTDDDATIDDDTTIDDDATVDRADESEDRIADASMADVDHTPPGADAGVNEVWERGRRSGDAPEDAERRSDQ